MTSDTQKPLECVKDDQIQAHSRKIAELETRADYKEKMIDDLNDKMDTMDKKMDKLLTGFHNFELQSNRNDAELEVRLKGYETELASLKQQIHDDKIEHENRLNRYLVIVGLVFTAISLIIKFI